MAAAPPARLPESLLEVLVVMGINEATPILASGGDPRIATDTRVRSTHTMLLLCFALISKSK